MCLHFLSEGKDAIPEEWQQCSHPDRADNLFPGQMAQVADDSDGPQWVSGVLGIFSLGRAPAFARHTIGCSKGNCVGLALELEETPMTFDLYVLERALLAKALG